MKNPNNQMMLYLSLPDALAQWYGHKVHELNEAESETATPYHYNINVPSVRDLEPLDIRRDEVISRYLRVALTKIPSTGDQFDIKTANIVIMIPNFYGQRADVYCHLGERERGTLKQIILDRCLRDFFHYIRSTNPIAYRLAAINVKEVIEQWMEQNGILITDKEYNFFIQHYQRAQSADRKRRYRAKLKEQNK